MKEKFYLAGPFFNPEQLRLIQQIEQIFIETDTAFFSPRLCDENSPGKKIDDAAAARIFERNVDMLKPGPHSRGAVCTSMLAVIDYLLPENQQLRVVSSERTAVSPPLYLPDIGTVFEMGMSFVLDIETYAFTQKPPDKMNVMLSQSVLGIINGLDALRCFLGEKDEDRRMAFLQKYKGKHV